MLLSCSRMNAECLLLGGNKRNTEYAIMALQLNECYICCYWVVAEWMLNVLLLSCSRRRARYMVIGCSRTNAICVVIMMQQKECSMCCCWVAAGWMRHVLLWIGLQQKEWWWCCYDVAAEGIVNGLVWCCSSEPMTAAPQPPASRLPATGTGHKKRKHFN